MAALSGPLGILSLLVHSEHASFLIGRSFSAASRLRGAAVVLGGCVWRVGYVSRGPHSPKVRSIAPDGSSLQPGLLSCAGLQSFWAVYTCGLLATFGIYLSLLSGALAIMRGVSVTVNRCDRFPAGTTVKAYPGASRHSGGPPGAPSVEEHVVAESGSCGPFTLLTADLPYVLYAQVAGVDRYLAVSDSTFTAPGTLKERIKARQEAAGV